MHASPLTPGELVADRYRVVGLIASGGMGAVFDATDERLGRAVALKVLRPELLDDHEIVRRFEREARAAAGLAHPGIAMVLDYGTTATGSTFLVLEKVPGRTLAQLLSTEGRLAPARAATIVARALEALSVAHANGIVHRDLKPANLMVFPVAEGREEVKVLDFGIAQLTRSATYTRLTRTGVLLGTPSFMAPEQIEGGQLDARADLYAMGVVLYCLLTATRPFQGELDAVLQAVLTETPPRLDTLPLGISSALADVVARALEKDPSRRFQSAAEMATALLAATSPSAPLAPSPLAPSPLAPSPLAPSPLAPSPLAPSRASLAPSPLAPSSATLAPSRASLAPSPLAPSSAPLAPSPLAPSPPSSPAATQEVRARSWPIVLLGVVLGVPLLAAGAFLILWIGVTIAVWARIDSLRSMAPTTPLLAPSAPTPSSSAPPPVVVASAASDSTCVLAVACCQAYGTADCTYIPLGGPELCRTQLALHRSLLAEDARDATACYPPGEAPAPREASAACRRAEACCRSWYAQHGVSGDDAVCNDLVAPPYSGSHEHICLRRIDLDRRMLTTFHHDSSACDEDPPTDPRPSP